MKIAWDFTSHLFMNKDLFRLSMPLQYGLTIKTIRYSPYNYIMLDGVVHKSKFSFVRVDEPTSSCNCPCCTRKEEERKKAESEKTNGVLY
jgi:hypothetical protein